MMDFLDKSKMFNVIQQITTHKIMFRAKITAERIERQLSCFPENPEILSLFNYFNQFYHFLKKIFF